MIVVFSGQTHLLFWFNFCKVYVATIPSSLKRTTISKLLTDKYIYFKSNLINLGAIN